VRLAVAELEQLIGDILPWREVMSGGPRWLTWELCATKSARTKACDWLHRVSRPWFPPDPGAVHVKLAFLGDDVIHSAVTRVLCELPPPVRDYALQRVTFLGVGVRTLGWAGSRIGFGDRPWLVVLSAVNAKGGADELRDLVGHELAHTWLGVEPAADQVAAGAFWQQTVYDVPLEELPEADRAELIRRRREYAHGEELARALARSWGFRDFV
jgi:hypothetical protein